jgi:hypothetical protein
MNTVKLNKRQKHIASCVNPRYGGFSKTPEIQQVKKLARGHYWIEPDFEEYCSFSPDGKRKFFTYSFCNPAKPSLAKRWKNTARKCARLWAAGKKEQAEELDEANWNHYQNHPNKWSKRNYMD